MCCVRADDKKNLLQSQLSFLLHSACLIFHAMMHAYATYHSSSQLTVYIWMELVSFISLLTVLSRKLRRTANVCKKMTAYVSHEKSKMQKNNHNIQLQRKRERDRKKRKVIVHIWLVVESVCVAELKNCCCLNTYYLVVFYYFFHLFIQQSEFLSSFGPRLD